MSSILQIRTPTGEVVIVDYDSKSTYGDIIRLVMREEHASDYVLVDNGNVLDNRHFVDRDVGMHLLNLVQGAKRFVFLKTLDGKTVCAEYFKGNTYGTIVQSALDHYAPQDNPEDYFIVLYGKRMGNNEIADCRTLTTAGTVHLLKDRNAATRAIGRRAATRNDIYRNIEKTKDMDIDIKRPWSDVPLEFKQFISLYHERRNMSPRPDSETYWNSLKNRTKQRIVREYLNQ